MRSHAKASSAGSSTRQSKGRFVLVLAASAFATLALFAASASAAKQAVDYFGNATGQGSLGGEFNGPRGIAVNTGGAGPADAGDIYVVDDFNSRIQRFDSDGGFVSAWGADVIQAGKPGDQAGTDPFEICTVAADCKAGAESGGNGAVSGNGALNSPQSVAVDGDTGNVYVSDRDNLRIDEYAGDGTFIRSFGFDVDATEAATGYEVCPATDVCKAGVAGAGAGQIGETFSQGTLGVAISPADGNASAGTLFLADSQNRRVNTYDLDGTDPSSFGSETQFGEGQPRRIAVDSRGIVYASDAENGPEIERYDTEDANGGGVGFLAPIAMPPLLEGSSESATSGLAVDPDSDGAGADEDVLYVLRDPFSGETVVQQFGPTNDPGLSAAPTAVDDTHGAGAGFDEVNGLGLDEAGGRLFVSSTGNIPGVSGFPHRVYVLDDSLAPGVSIDPVTTFDAHSATFSGSVDPNGALAAYRFEYVDDAEFQANGFANASRVPASDVGVGKGDAPVAVQQQIATGLIAGTLYHVRLLARPQFDTATTVTGPTTFATDASGPTIVGTAASVGTEEATLRGTIDPENEATTYRFEWGPTSAYGNATTPVNLPAGKSPVAVAAPLGGLTPGATYHYRLVATNGTDTTEGPDRTFTMSIGPPQFQPRAYELVSPYPTGGDAVIAQLSDVSVSENGDRVHFGNTAKPLLDSKLVPPPDHLHFFPSSWRYGAVRGPAGWQTEEYGLSNGPAGAGVSADGTRYLFTTQAGEYYSRLDPDDQNGTFIGEADRTEVYQRQPDGSLVWISRDPRIPVGTPQTDLGDATLFGDNRMGQMSVDGRTVVFGSERPLDDADTTPTTPFGAPLRIYKWTEGELEFIGIRPDGSVPSQGSRLSSSEQVAVQGTVARDGSRVLFSALREDESGAAFDGRTLYIQTDGEPTVEAVKETGVPPLPARQPFATTYRGASTDLSRAFFTSNSRLTPDSGASATTGGATGEEGEHDLYVYDIDADKVRDLTPRLDGIDDPTVDPAPADRGRALGLVANSEDGKRVYFVADAQYDVAPNPDGELPSPEGRNLYLAEMDGIDDPIELRFVAALGPGDGNVWQKDLTTLGEKTASASPDGSVLGFGSKEPLTGQALGGTRQLFVYDADADTLECASCPGDGSLPKGDVNAVGSTGAGGYGWQSPNGYRRWVSTDGRVFFHSATQLLEDDTNLVEDVYEYLDGELRLVSAGTGGGSSYFEDISRDGSTVIFNTQDALVPFDEEPGVPKLYAARVGGGFPLAPKPAPCDLGAGACEGPGTSAPQQPGAGSAAFEGAGDPNPKKAAKRCPKAKRKVRRGGKVRCAPRKSRKQNRNAKNDRRASR